MVMDSCIFSSHGRGDGKMTFKISWSPQCRRVSILSRSDKGLGDAELFFTNIGIGDILGESIVRPEIGALTWVITSVAVGITVETGVGTEVGILTRVINSVEARVGFGL